MTTAKNSLRHLAVAVVAVAALATGASPANAAGEGKVRFVNTAGSDWDRHTSDPTPEVAGWMRDRFFRQKVYEPYFNHRTSWYPNAWVYRDLYAIYRTSELARERPEWILKDPQGRNLYIQYGCANGTCPQYAADVGNPAFRAYWISQVRETFASGNYRGLYIDDVNMLFRVSDGYERETAPIDPRTGVTMTFADWRRYIAEFAEEVRAAFPHVEIAHNPIWFADQNDQYVKRAHAAADYINLERGVNDDGLVAGGGKWGYETFLRHVDQLHAMGRHVIFDSYAEGRHEAEYNLASYLLVNRSHDGFKAEYRYRPDDWWSAGYELDLGSAKGPRYEWNGLLRRDFDRGYVLVNQPDRPTRSVPTPGAVNLDGQPQDVTTVGETRGIVLIDHTPPAPEPPVTPGPIVLVPKPNPVRDVPRGPKRNDVQAMREKTERTAPARTNPSKRAQARSRAQARARARAKRRLQRAVLLRGRVRRAGSGRVTLVVHRKYRKGKRVVRRTSARVSRNGRFGRLLRGLPPARYVVIARYGHGAHAKVVRKRAFRIRY